MLSNKRSRIFVSFLTLMMFLTVLAIGTQAIGVEAEGPTTGNALDEAAQHALDAAEAAKRTAGSLIVNKSVAPSSHIIVGDEITYTVVISNDTGSTVSGITVQDELPHFTRFNRLNGSNVAVNSDRNRVASTAAFSLANGSQTSFDLVVDTTGFCGVPITNKAVVSQGGKSVTIERQITPWDHIYTSTNASDDDFFAAATGSWERGTPGGLPNIGTVSGNEVWATNLTGNYINAAADTRFTHSLTATINFTDIVVADGADLFLNWSEYFNTNTNFDYGLVKMNGVTIYDTRTEYGLTSVDTKIYNNKQIKLVGDGGRFQASALANKLITLEFLFGVNDANEDFGWYIDDIAITACDSASFKANKAVGLAPFTASTCNVNTASNTGTSKSGGLSVISGTNVNYCYAIQNTGNITLTYADIDDHVRVPSGVLTDVNVADTTTVIGPGGTLWVGLTSTRPITQVTVNTATFKVKSSFLTRTYQVMTESTSTKFNDIVTGTEQEINDKDDVFTISLPITFTFFSQVYVPGDPIAIGLNGSILFADITTLSDGMGTTNMPLPLTGTSQPGILPLWDNYDETHNAKIYTDVQGTAPERDFIVQWNDVPHEDNSGSADGATFQVILHEETNGIQFVYKDVDFGNAVYDNGASATIGLNSGIADAIQYSYNGGQAISNDFAITFQSDSLAAQQKSVTVGIQEQLNISLAKTVATSEAAACSASDSISVNAGTSVYYCYTIQNHSNIAIELHDLNDNILGELLEGHEASVAANGSYQWTTGPHMINATTVNTATWTAHAGNYQSARSSRTDHTISYSSKFVDIGAGGGFSGQAVNFNNEGHDDEGEVDIGFDFYYFGKKFTQTVVGRNGGLIFDVALANADIFPDNQPLPNADHPMAIFPFWDDMESNSGGVYYQLDGTAPNRMLRVQWDRLVHFGNSEPGTFQVVLYEGSSQIDFNYKDVIFGPPTTITTDDNFDYGRSATIGLSKDSSKSITWSYGDGTTGTIRGVAPSTLWTQTFPVTNGETIRWTPLVGMASDVATVTVVPNPSIIFTKTVGTVADTCATTQEITVTAGDMVYYCFWIENNGDVTLTSHTLFDGIVNINNTYNFTLNPSDVVNITEIPGGGVEGRVVTTDTTNTATWTATNGTNSDTETSSATVNVIQPPTAVEMTGVTATNAGGQLPLGSLVVGMLLLVAGGYVLHRRRNQYAS